MKSVVFRAITVMAAMAVSVPAANETVDPAVAEPPAEIADEAAITTWVRDLGNEKYGVREAASAKLWKCGVRAIPALQAAAASDDPEAAFRARDIMLKLDLGISPGTDPEVVRLIDRYKRADATEKIRVLEQLMAKKAFGPLLRLFAKEKDPKVIEPWAKPVRGLAMRVAREALLGGDPSSARETLELFRNDEVGRLVLAAFYRGQGTLAEELQRLDKDGDKADALWALALRRVAGDAEKAYAAAMDGSKPGVAGAMAMLDGDPLPWLRFGPAFSRIMGGLDVYTPLAIKRWEGNALDKEDFAAISKRLKSKDHATRLQAGFAAILLGDPQMAEPALAKSALWAVFKTLDMVERVDDALELLGIDPTKPDYDKWVASRFEVLLDKDDEKADARRDLYMMASFLESRGLMAEQESAFDKRLEALAKKDENDFTSLLGSMCGGLEAAVGPVLRVGPAWAGDDDERWEDLLVEIHGDNEDIMPAWAFLGEVDPKATLKERLAGLLAIGQLGKDPEKLFDRWMEACWRHLGELDAADRDTALVRMEYLLGLGGDVTNRLKLRGMRPRQQEQAPAPDENEDERPGLADDDVVFMPDPDEPIDAPLDDEMARKLSFELLDLSAAGAWAEAADLALELLNRRGLASQIRPDLHAYAASCLRRAGREEDAARHDQWVEKLALGDGAVYQRIAQGYAFGADYDRAAVWWQRAAFETNPESELFGMALLERVRLLLEEGEWAKAAAAAEVLGQMCSQFRYAGAASITSVLQMRQQADLARALAMVGKDRARALAMLEHSHALAPCDGSLADHFFPALRKAGLIEEHDRLFALTWQAVTRAVDKFPGSTTTRNTAAWLASRAGSQLDAAEELIKEALRERPRQGAYLDTMAEVQFAKGKREEALKWSQQAIDNMPADSAIRRQYHRFKSAPLPEWRVPEAGAGK